MSDLAVGVLGCVFLVGLFLTGIEMAFAMTIIGVLGSALLTSPSAALNLLANDFSDAFQSYTLAVVPLFVLMGQVAFNAGIARRLFDSAHRFFGHVPGGLAIATVAGATAFKAICGSMVATSATFASVAVPEMDRFSYSKKLSTGIVATVGSLGVLIPPSLTLIVLGIVTQQSIGKLFLAGVIPGLMMALGFAVVIYAWARIRPEIAPACKPFSWKERVVTMPAVIWPIVIFLIVMGGMLYGFFTPTEAGSIGTLAVIVLSVAKRQIDLGGFKRSFVEALRTASMVLLLVAASTVLGHFIAATDIPDGIVQWVTKLPVHRHVVMVVIFLFFLLGGSFIDDLAFMVLAAPIFFPAITQMGYDPIWACIILSLTVCVGAVIPPVAMCVFIVRNITKVPIGTIYSGVYPFLISMILVIALLFMFPQLVTYLPSLMN